MFFAKSASAADAETAQITVYDNSVSRKKYWTVPSNYDCAKADKVSETQYKAKDGGKTAPTRDNPQGVQIWEKGDKISGNLCKVKPTMKKVSGALNSQALCDAKLIQDGSIKKDWEKTHTRQPTASYKRPVYSDGTIKTPGITDGAFRDLKTLGCYLVSYSGVGGTTSSARLESAELMYKSNGEAANKAEKVATQMFSLTKNSKSSILPEQLEKLTDLTVLYARLSQDDDYMGDSSSIQNQYILLENFAKSQQFTPIVFLSDDGISGLTFERPAMSLTLKLVNDGRVKRIIVKDLSRFGRDNIQVKTYTQMIFPAKDVQFIAFNDSVDTANRGADTMISLKSMINDMHSRDLSEKERQAYQIKGNRGLPTYPNVHYGYIKVPDYKESKMWVVEEESAAIVRRIFHDYLSGKSQWAIARTLREEKILTPSHHYAKLGVKTLSKLSTNPYYWGTSTIGSILRRYEYCGHLINFKTYSKSYKLKKRLANSPDKIKIFRDHHEAIIDEETFNLAKIKREREHHPRPTKSTPIGVFNGLVYCADCGIHHNFRGNSGYYYCKGSISKVIQCPSAHGINENQLTEIVLREISKISKLVIDDKNALAQHLRDKIIDNLGKLRDAWKSLTRFVENCLKVILLDRSAIHDFVE